MLVSHRRSVAPALGALVETRSLLHPSFRLDVTHNERIVHDERLQRTLAYRRPDPKRSWLLAVVEGRMQVEGAGIARWLGPGDVVLARDRAGLLVRQEGERFVAVSVAWQDDTLARGLHGGARITRLREADFQGLEQAAATIAPHLTANAAGEAFRGALAHLRSVVPFDVDAPSAWREEAPPQATILSRALDRTLSNLSRQPMMVDLEREVGVSSRQLQRLVARFNAHYGFDERGWRDTLVRRRMLVGCCLMTVPGATTDLVASALGYGSATAFCRAFAESRLPSPMNIRAATWKLVA
jgi:AraC-like DNA-binding protein